MPQPNLIPGPGFGPPSFFPWNAPPPPRGSSLASPLRLGSNWYVRTTGSDNNGGSDNAAAALRTGTDGVTNNTTTFTSASAAFTSADVGRGICIGTGVARHHKITAVNSGTNVTLDRAATNSASGQTWAIGGAWATVRVAIGDPNICADTNTPVAAGDTVWVGAGTYRGNNSAGASWSPKGAVNYVGDVTGLNTGDAAGPVVLTTWTTDKTPNSNVLFNFVTKPYLNFINFNMVCGGTGVCVQNAGGYCNFTNCELTNGSSTGVVTLSPVVGMGPILFDRCQMYARIQNANTGMFAVILARRTAAGDWDCGIEIRNSVLIGGANPGIVRINSSGAGSSFGGGVIVRNCLLEGMNGVYIADANCSVTIPCRVYNSVVMCDQSLTAATSGQLIEDYNELNGSIARTLVPVGPHSDSNPYITTWARGQERIWGGTQRPFGEPLAGSPYIAFGAYDTSAGLLDQRGGPRPSVASRWAVGAFQRGNNFGKETGTVHTGSNAISVTGDGFQDFDLAVDAGALTISVYGRFDSSYVGPLPQLQIVKAAQVGVGDVTVPFSSNALNAWEQQSITIIPTAAGIVTVRLVAGDTSGVGKTIFDTFSVA